MGCFIDAGQNMKYIVNIGILLLVFTLGAFVGREYANYKASTTETVIVGPSFVVPLFPRKKTTEDYIEEFPDRSLILPDGDTDDRPHEFRTDWDYLETITGQYIR